jgi:triacylglycerol lipase
MRRTGQAFGAAIAALLLAGGPIIGATASATQRHRTPVRAVVLVSGLDSASPFSTPARSCDGKEGSSWGLPGGVATALKRAGFSVYTAPVRKGASAPPAACATPAPGPSDWLNSTGDVDANGAALGRFLAFLHQRYHVDVVTLVGHSDGGLWSRSAISMHPAGLTIDGLITLGTPHTGSPVADVGSELANLSCGRSGAACTIFQKLASGLLSQLGPTAVDELSSPFLKTWNPRLKLAGCTVTTIEGTAINPPPLRSPQPSLSGYYLPADGLVGRSSAADQPAKALDGTMIPAAAIARLVNGGAFPVYHTPQLGTPSELDDAAINAAIVKALRRQSPACAGTRKRQPATLTVHLDSTSTAGLHGGDLGTSAKGDLVFAPPSTKLSCGTASLTASPLLPVPLLKTYVTGSCSRLRSSATALLLHTTTSTVTLTLNGTALTIATRQVRALTVDALRRGAWVRVPLKRGRGTVPGGNLVQLRLTGRTAGGAAVSGSAPMNG